eukprot:PITA_28781
MDWKIHQMDVKTTFLNGFIQEEVYIEQPQGFEVHGKESHVCRLKKALYGLKQARRAWKSTSRCCFGLGSAIVSWFSRKQQSVALSSAEAEYMAASLASCEAIWLRKMFFGLFGQSLRPSVIYCDNQSCIKLTENPVVHDRSKHIGIRYHFIRDYVQKGAVKLEYISTDEQVADILTKDLPRGKHVYFRDKMGVVRNTFLGKREC